MKYFLLFVVLAFFACSDDASNGISTSPVEAVSSSAKSDILSSSSIAEPQSSSSESFDTEWNQASNGISTSPVEAVSSSAKSDILSSSSIAEPQSSSSESFDTEWNQARLTWYESYPEEGSEECIEYNGCEWAGWFAGLNDQQTREWVAENNIIAVHEKDWEAYKLKTFRLRKNGHEIDAVVYDMCSDSDCDGCCTKNAGTIGFLIDIETNTKSRFGNQGSGVVEWICLDCE